jgi:hypothetical protein
MKGKRIMLFENQDQSLLIPIGSRTSEAKAVSRIEGTFVAVHLSGGIMTNCRRTLLAPIVALLFLCGMSAANAQTCKISYGLADDAKPNKLYLYFPTADDSTYPEFGVGGLVTSPAHAFNVADLTNYTGNADDLRNAIFQVVSEDYCEFNVQVLQTTTAPPTTFARRNTVAVGTDSQCTPTGTTWGLAQAVDTGDATAVDFARVWAGSYNCSTALTGTNSTLERWARAIGGTCAHEGGHNVGLSHADGLVLATGEDVLVHHIMASGSHYSDEDRAGYRRHFSDHEYSLLASNVGLSIQTMWNWDLVNPNAETAVKLRMDFLSTQPSLILSWSYSGSRSPWVNPTVTGPSGTATFKGTTYNRYQIEWSVGQAWDNGSSGQVPGGANFHVGATFSSVNFSDPDPIIITNVVLLDGTGAALALHPRLLGYDAGTLDAADGALNLRFFNFQPEPLVLQNVVVRRLPRVLSLDQMISSFDQVSLPDQRTPSPDQVVQCEKMIDPRGLSFRPWPGSVQRVLKSMEIRAKEGELKVPLAHLSDKRHIYRVVTEKDCVPQDSTKEPDVARCGTGINVDLFPSTTVYITATVVDPKARHWDREKKQYVTGPLSSQFFYQIAGRHPDLNKNYVDDYIDIATGRSKDTRVKGVPDDAKIEGKTYR